MLLLFTLFQFFDTAHPQQTESSKLLDDLPIPPGPFGVRLFLTSKPNVLNSVWTCKQLPDTVSNSSVWYNEQGKNSDHNKTSLFQVESMGGQLLANYQQELEIKYDTTLKYRTCCNSLCSKVFTVNYLYWNSTVEDPRWAMLVMGSIGTYNTTLTALRSLSDKADQLKNALWAIPGGIVIDESTAEEPTSPSIKKWITWLQIAENVTGSIPTIAAPSQSDLLPYNGTNKLTPWFRIFFKQPYLSSSSEVNWYSFQHRNLHITAVCTYCDISEDSAQYKWLEKDLAAAANNSKATPWKIVIGHMPVYSEQDPNELLESKKHIAALLKKYKVDIALWSHDRWYERTYPIIEGEVSDQKYSNSLENVNGTIHLTCGTGGIPLHTYRHTNTFSSLVAYFEARRHGACSVHTINNNLLETSFVYEVEGGAFHTIDHVQIGKSEHDSGSNNPHNYHTQYMKMLKTTGLVIVGGAVIGLLVIGMIKAYRNKDNANSLLSKMSAYSKARGPITFDPKRENVMMQGEEVAGDPFQIEDDTQGLLEYVPVDQEEEEDIL